MMKRRTYLMKRYLLDIPDDLVRYVETCGGVLSIGVYPVVSG